MSQVVAQDLADITFDRRGDEPQEVEDSGQFPIVIDPKKLEPILPERLPAPHLRLTPRPADSDRFSISIFDPSSRQIEVIVALTEIDRSLLKNCLAQEPAGWQAFVDRFIGLFVHVIQHTAHARSIKTTQTDIDDLCSEIFVTILSNDRAVLRNFRGKSSLATYLAIIARRVVVRKLGERRMAEKLGHVTAHHTPAEPASLPKDSQRVEDRDEIQQMLQGLTNTEAEIVRQFHIEGRTYREISTGLGIPENTIGPTLTRARSRIRHREVQQH